MLQHGPGKFGGHADLEVRGLQGQGGCKEDFARVL